MINNNNIIIYSSPQNKRKLTENISTYNDIYVHDIGKWALVKCCNYPENILYPNINNIPTHVIKSLQ